MKEEGGKRRYGLRDFGLCLSTFERTKEKNSPEEREALGIERETFSIVGV